METNYFNLSPSLLYLILALILFIKRSPNRKANNFLAVFFVLMALYTLLVYLHLYFVKTDKLSCLSYYLPLDAVVMMLMSPCFYCYILSLLNRPLKLIRWSTLLHLIPLLPGLIFNLIFAFEPVAYRVDWLIHDFYEGSTVMIVINAVLYLQVIFYLIISYRAVSKQQKVSVYVENNGYRTNITWVRIFIIVNIIIVCLSLPICFFIHNEQTNILIGQTAMNIDLIFLFILTALKIGSIDTEKIEAKKTPHQIDETRAACQWAKLTTHIETHKPYRDENCSKRSLSEQTNIPEHQLTTLLNDYAGVTFADYINRYRIEEALIYLEDKSKERKTIDLIAIECGFGSRSSFYRAFEKKYNITPTAYRKQHDRNQKV